MTTSLDRLEQMGLKLVDESDGLALTDGHMSIRGDFKRMLPRLKPQNLHRELLVKAAKVKTVEGELPRAIDATAGLGDDALLLAAAGFDVTLFERNPIIAQLLFDALDRASHNPKLAPIVERMHLVEGDSTTALSYLDFKPDVVLLDPMFPAKGKDAAAKKKLQMLQKIEQPCEDETALFDTALRTQARKVIVKRPVKGPHLAGRKPSYTLRGKAIRFDVYAQ